MLQIFLPKIKSCSIQFLQAILSSRKRFFWKNEQRGLKLPLWPELSISRVWPQAAQLPRFNEYIPDDWSLEHIKRIERAFFFGVLITLAPEYVEHLVIDIRAQRINQQANRIIRPQAIGVAPEWVTHLLSQPFISGKLLHLLLLIVIISSLLQVVHMVKPVC